MRVFLDRRFHVPPRWAGIWPLLGPLLLALPFEGAPELQLLVLAALVFSAAYVGRALARRLLPRLPWADLLISAAACAIACCLLIGLLLGHCGLLYGDLFRGTLAGVTAIVWWWARRSPGSARADRPRALPGRSLQGPLEHWVVLACCAVAAGGLVAGVWANRYAAPGTFAYDDTYYHLTTVATWNIGHDLAMPRFSYGDPRPQFYPFASELLAWELTTPFAGGDFAARWIELPFALLSLCAAGVIARRLGAPPGCALLAPLVYASILRAYPDYALTAGNDHAVTFLILACLHAAVVLARRLTLGRAAYAGIALGLLLATKYTALLFAPLLAAVLAIAVTIGWRRSAAPLRAGVAAVLGCAVIALVAGGYSYLRNFVTKGNPVFPIGVHLGPIAFPGWRGGAVHLAGRRPEAAIHAWSFPWVRTDLLGNAFRWTALPASVLAPLVALAARIRARLLIASIFSLAPLLYLEFLWLIEDHRDIRYIFGAVAIAAVAAAWLVGRFPEPIRRLLTVATAGLATSRWLTGPPASLAAIAIVAVIASVAAVAFHRPLRRPLHGLAIAVLALLAMGLLSFGGGLLVRRYEAHRLDRFPPAAALSALTRGRPAGVAYSGWNQPYLFTGTSMQNPVYMVPTGGSIRSMFYHWGGPTADPYRVRRRVLWLANLCSLGIEYVVHVDSPHSGPVSRWAAGAPELSLVYEGERTRIWRFDRNYCHPPAAPRSMTESASSWRAPTAVAPAAAGPARSAPGSWGERPGA